MSIWKGRGFGRVLTKGKFLGGPDVVRFSVGEEEVL
jgi:hypothetical protein